MSPFPSNKSRDGNTHSLATGLTQHRTSAYGSGSDSSYQPVV